MELLVLDKRLSSYHNKEYRKKRSVMIRYRHNISFFIYSHSPVHGDNPMLDITYVCDKMNVTKTYV